MNLKILQCFMIYTEFDYRNNLGRYTDCSLKMVLSKNSF